MSPEEVHVIQMPFPMISVIVVSVMAAWVFTTWLRIKNGYPLENSWGKPIHPKSDEAVERVKLLSQENAQPRAELGSVKDRLANVERIVTDSGTLLDQQITALRDRAN